MNIKLHLIILSTDIAKNKKYVLSTDKENLVLPCFDINPDNSKNIKQSIEDFLKERIVISPLELITSLLFINPTSLPEELRDDNTLNIIYGSVIVFNTNTNGLYWQEFDFLLPHAYSNLLFDAIHTLS